jgi:cytochrome c oxidase subunit 1
VNVTFFPLHFLGLMGMTRRVYTYAADLGWGPLNLLATVGAFMIAASVLVFAANVALSLRGGRVAGPDPWGAHTLEWGTSSPPPAYNFLHIPVVQGLYALWERTPDQPVVTGIDPEKRYVLLTTVMDAEPESLHEHPGPTVWPLLAALAVGVTFIGGIFTTWGFVVGSALLFPALVGWAWRSGKPDGERDFGEEPA